MIDSIRGNSRVHGVDDVTASVAPHYALSSGRVLHPLQETVGDAGTALQLGLVVQTVNFRLKVINR